MYNQADLASISWWQWANLVPEERKDISLPESDKGEEYDVTNSRFYFGRDNQLYYNFTRACAAVNEGFVSGRIWGLQSDINSFLMDKAVTTTRVPLQYPLMMPMLNRLLGELSKITIQAKAEAVTQRTKTQREAFIMRGLALSQAAGVGRDTAQVIGNMGITADPAQAQDFAEKTFQDPLKKAINSLVTMTALRCEYELKRKHIGTNIANSGLGAVHFYINGSSIECEVLDTQEAVWDVNAKKPDLTDSEYWGVAKRRSVSDLCERYRAKRDQLKAIEAMVKSYNQTVVGAAMMWPNGLVPTYTCYYKDGRYEERGFIEGPNGPEIISINEIDPDTGKVRYTEDDLIDPPKNQFTLNWTGKTNTRFKSYLRYCTFIPREFIAGDPKNPGKKPGDMVLEHGIYPLQESDPDKVDSVRSPVKFCTWMNIGGFIVAPLTAAQSPQRVANQVTSDMVWRMSKATGRSPLIDVKAITKGGTMSVKQALQALKEGDPIPVDGSTTGGVPQTIGHADGGLDPNIFRQIEVLEHLEHLAESVVGLYGQNYGEPAPANKAVGVQQLQLQQAAVMLRPYFDAVQMLYTQMHQFMAQAGRQFYIRHPWTLIDMVGDDGYKTLLATKDFELEQFRMTTVLTYGAEERMQITDEMILNQLLPLELLSPQRAASLLGHSFPEDAYQAAAEDTRDRAIAAERAAQAQAQAAEAGMIMKREGELALREDEMYKQAIDVALQADQINAKSELPMMSQQAKRIFPEPGAAAA